MSKNRIDKPNVDLNVCEQPTAQKRAGFAEGYTAPDPKLIQSAQLALDDSENSPVEEALDRAKGEVDLGVG